MSASPRSVCGVFALGLHFSPFKGGDDPSYIPEMLQAVSERLGEKSSLEVAEFCDLGGHAQCWVLRWAYTQAEGEG